MIDTSYTKLAKQYDDAQRRDDQQECASLTDTIVKSAFKDTIKPGTKCLVEGKLMCAFGDYPGTDKFAASVIWLPLKDGLKVKADVTDAQFSTDAPSDSPQDASCIDLWVCPTGMYRERNQVTIVPKGTGGNAIVNIAPDPYEPFTPVKSAKSLGIWAKWKRTAKGYTVDTFIPWQAIRGHKSGWQRMPVKAAVNCATEDGKVEITTGMQGDPSRELFTYSVLMAK